jgi:hypothetical protein
MTAEAGFFTFRHTLQMSPVRRCTPFVTPVIAGCAGLPTTSDYILNKAF